MAKATNKVVDINQAKKDPWEIEWERCKPYIAKAVKYQDSYTIDDIEDKIRHGLFHLWPGKESAFVTEIIIFPQNKAMNLLFCGGNYKEIEEILESIEIFAKNAGIKRSLLLAGLPLCLKLALSVPSNCTRLPADGPQ